MNASNPPHLTLTHVLVRCIVFGCIWDRFVTARNSVQNGDDEEDDTYIDDGVVAPVVVESLEDDFFI